MMQQFNLVKTRFVFSGPKRKSHKEFDSQRFFTVLEIKLSIHFSSDS